MKPKKCKSLTAIAMLKKNRILKKKIVKGSPASSVRSTTPASLMNKALLSRLVTEKTPSHSHTPALIKKVVSKLVAEKTPTHSEKISAKLPKGKGNIVKSSAEAPGVRVTNSANDVAPPFEKSQGEICFEWLISPLTPAKFYEEVFEKRTFVVRRHNKDYYKGIFSCKELDRILREKHLKYGDDIDVTSYVNGVRKTHNADGRAYAPVIWDSYQNGRSIRLLRPQSVSKSIWKLNSVLSEYFGNFVGGNIYLTPPGTQGFAPHYDDIEAFILQLEGQKQWKVYNPKSEADELPRFSSNNFSQDELSKDFLDVVLQPGDLLYFPRGFIHQAKTNESEHSLHLTLSTCQRSTWGDLLEKLLPRTLQAAIEEDVEFRRSLPRDYLSYMGVVNSDKNLVDRDSFLLKIKHLVQGLTKYLCTDATVDQMGKLFVHSALPPVITEEEKSCSIHGDGEFWKDGKVHNTVEMDLDTKVRLLRKSAVRIVMEDNTVRLYHSLENTRIFQEVQPQYVEMSFNLIPAVESLLEAYPKYVAVQDLPLNTDDEKMEVAGLLYDKGLLVSEFPLMVADD